MRARARFSEPCADSNRSRCVGAAEGAPVDVPLIRGPSAIRLPCSAGKPSLSWVVSGFASLPSSLIVTFLGLWTSRLAGQAQRLFRAPKLFRCPRVRAWREMSARSGRSVLTLDLSISIWSAKVKFVEGGGVAGMRLRAGRTVSFNDDQPQSTIVRFCSFISGQLRWLTFAGKHLPAPIFSRFYRAKRFLLDFSEISAVACLEAFIEVPVRPRRLERGGSRRSCARGEATDRESGCGQ
jgi:hypothetical protein